ncbi:MAG: NAD-dependent epimerase/dehydratase family protein [Heteroscytonema crispum UTEX LB 1556]
MNIAIIGCGYVGYAVAKYWQQKMTLVVTATTTTPERISELQAVAQKVVLVHGNDAEKLKSVLQNQDVVLLSIAPKQANAYEETYLNTANTLVSVIKETSVKQIIYTGTFSVYGDQKGTLVDEETPVAPITENAKILNETEKVLLSASSEKLHVCILRLGGIYGPGRELVKIYSRVPGTTRPGNGEEPANWIHLDDIVAAIEFARQHRLQGIYNLTDDENLTNRQVIERVLEEHNLPKVIWDSSLKSNRPYHVKVSNQKIKDAGYKFIRPRIIFK